MRLWCSCCPPLQLLQGLLLFCNVLLLFLFCWLRWGFSQFFRAREMHASVRVVVEAGRRCPLPRSCSIALFSPHRLITFAAKPRVDTARVLSRSGGFVEVFVLRVCKSDFGALRM